jgi:hypothetical protein
MLPLAGENLKVGGIATRFVLTVMMNMGALRDFYAHHD